MEYYLLKKQCYKPLVNKVTGETIQLKPYEVPESITFLDTIPRTKADKADYKLLEELAKEETEHKIMKRELKQFFLLFLL